MAFLAEAVDFVVRYKWEFIVYIGIILLIYLNRKKFEFQGKVIALYRTKIGLKFMDSIATKYPKAVRGLGYAGVYFGYIVMILITGYVLFGLYQLIFVPEAPAVLQPILPGIQLPGSDFKLPLFEGIVSLFIVVVIHEFSHGVVSRAHKIPVHNSGFVMFGPIPGAFVEPDEKKLTKAKDLKKLSVFAAGPWSNFITAFIVFLLIAHVFGPIDERISQPKGIIFSEFTPGSPGEISLDTDVTYIKFNGENMTTYAHFAELYYNTEMENFYEVFNNLSAKNRLELYNYRVGDVVTFSTADKDYKLTLGSWPASKNGTQLRKGEPYIGTVSEYVLTDYENRGKWWMQVWRWVFGVVYNTSIKDLSVIQWIFILSLGLGAANLLPLGPVDGGRMLQVPLIRWFGEKKGNQIFIKTSMIIFAIVIILVVIPMAKAIIAWAVGS